MGQNKDLENIVGLIRHIIKVNLKIILFVEQVLISGMMGKNIMEPG